MRDLRTLPKTNLHLHLTGAMRPSTLHDLASRHGLPVPPLQAVRHHTWADFQHRYDAAREVIRTPADVARVVTEAALDDAADGCCWLELQVDPTSYAARFGGLEAFLETVLAAAASAPIPAGVIVASSWARPGSHAVTLARLAAAYADQGVVGFGLSNDERLGHVDDFVPAFHIAASAGLVLTPHGGFYTGPDHVAACVRRLGATRIGHGTAAVRDPATLALLASRGVTLEICPTSYPPFDVHPLSDVPIAALLDAGVPVTLATDDPLLFGTGLAGQYQLGRSTLALTDHQLATIATHGVQASAAPAPLKATLLAAITTWLAQ